MPIYLQAVIYLDPNSPMSTLRSLRGRCPNLFNFFCITLLFTCLSPCRKDQFAVLNFVQVAIILCNKFRFQSYLKRFLVIDYELTAFQGRVAKNILRLKNGPDKNDSNNGNEHVGIQKKC